MFSTPNADPAAAVRAAERTQDLFLDLVARVVGAGLVRRYAALLLSSVHGASGLEQSGHLAGDKWQSTAEDVVDLLLSLLPDR